MTSCASPRGPRQPLPRRPAGVARRPPDRPREPAPARAAAEGPAQARRSRAPTRCSSASGSPTPPTARSAPTPAACAAGWTSPPAWSSSGRSCSSTSRRPGLDPSSRIEMWNAIAAARRQTAPRSLLTTQYLEEADRLADEIVVLNGGRTVAAGTPAELKARVGARRVHVTLLDDLEERRAAVRAPRAGTRPAHPQALAARPRRPARPPSRARRARRRRLHGRRGVAQPAHPRRRVLRAACNRGEHAPDDARQTQSTRSGCWPDAACATSRASPRRRSAPSSCRSSSS